MDENSDLYKMALGCYGYGRWDAPYWFIGPEQGLSRGEMQPRIDAWLHLGRETGLSDCREFHKYIDEERWHRESPLLQRTWKQLMRLLMTFLGESADNESLRIYQRDQWGMLNGDTCVIELSGLPAHDLKAGEEQKLSLFVQKEEINAILRDRIKFIREKLLTHEPEFVVMYGTSAREHFENIAGGAFPADGILKLGSSILLRTAHPVAHGLGNNHWVLLGERLRELNYQLTSPQMVRQIQ